MAISTVQVYKKKKDDEILEAVMGVIDNFIILDEERIKYLEMAQSKIKERMDAYIRKSL